MAPASPSEAACGWGTGIVGWVQIAAKRRRDMAKPRVDDFVFIMKPLAALKANNTGGETLPVSPVLLRHVTDWRQGRMAASLIGCLGQARFPSFSWIVFSLPGHASLRSLIDAIRHRCTHVCVWSRAKHHPGKIALSPVKVLKIGRQPGLQNTVVFMLFIG